jgi:anti-sigma factor RsiW
MTDWRRFMPRRLARAGRRAPASAELTCREMVELVTAYLDDAIEPAQRAALERHLAGCPHCTEYFAQIRLVRAAAGRVEPEDIAPQARQELLALFSRWQAEPEADAEPEPELGTDADTDTDAQADPEPEPEAHAQDPDPDSGR